LDSIQQRELQEERDDAMLLLGWLTFAKQPLKWREIQVMKSFNRDKGLVDMELFQFRVEPKDLCESFVEVTEDGTVELVHLSARE
jgi:hypothetical protein